MKSKLPTSRAKTAYGLLSEVCALIIEEPLRYDQRDWLSRRTQYSACMLPLQQYPSCGTVGCVAGWVATMTRRRFNEFESPDIAQAALGLSDEQKEELFSGMAVRGLGQTVEHARAGVKHIRKFQKKYRAQLLAKKVR